MQVDIGGLACGRRFAKRVSCILPESACVPSIMGEWTSSIFKLRSQLGISFLTIDSSCRLFFPCQISRPFSQVSVCIYGSRCCSRKASWAAMSSNCCITSRINKPTRRVPTPAYFQGGIEKAFSDFHLKVGGFRMCAFTSNLVQSTNSTNQQRRVPK